MLWVAPVPTPKQESVSLVTSKIAAVPMTRESGLMVLEENMMTPTRVETIG